MSIITRVKRIGLSGLVLIPLAAATSLNGCAFARHNDPAISAPSTTGRSVVASVIGAAMGGGATNHEHAKDMLNALSAAHRDVDNAERSGDSNAQMQAGIKMLGTLVRGGSPRVTPIAHDVLGFHIVSADTRLIDTSIVSATAPRRNKVRSIGAGRPTVGRRSAARVIA